MIPATVQQLDVVSRKASRLEQTVATHIETLKAARKERTDAEELVRDLRARLLEAEERHETAILVHEKAETTLRLAATEYSRAQLLQKRLTNTLKDLQGFNRSVVITEGGDVYKSTIMRGDEPSVVYHEEGGHAGAAEDDENIRSVALGSFLRVADPCTIHVPTMRKTIVVDAITHSSGGRQSISDNDNNSNNGVAPSSPQSSSSSSSTLSSLLIPSMVSDALGGYNVCYTAVGPKKAGKTTAMWGALRETNKISSAGAGGGRGGGAAFNISPQNAKLRGAISDPSGFLLAKYFLGFEHFRGFADASSTGGTTPPKGGSDSANSTSCPVAVAPLFMHHLFSQFSAYDVTHFNIRVSFVEMVEDGLSDLLMMLPQQQQQQGSAAAHNHSLLSGGDGTPMPIGFFGNFDEESGGDFDSNDINRQQNAVSSSSQDARRIGWSRLHTATSIQVRSEEEFYLNLQRAFMNREHKLMGRQRAMAKAGVPLGGFATAAKKAPSALAARGGVGGGSANEQQLLPSHEVADLLGGHLVLTVSIENFNSRGNFRRSTAVFCDVAGGLTPTTTSTTTIASPSSHMNGPPPVTTNEQLWASKGAWALTDVISMASAMVATAMAESHRRSASSSSHNNNLNKRDMVNMSANNMSTFSSSAAAGPLSPFAVTAAAEAAHRALASTVLPHTSNRLVHLLQEVFGGNAKGVLLCVLPRASALAGTHHHDGENNNESGSSGKKVVGDGSRVGGGAAAQPNPNHNLAAAVNALAYAHHFKGTCHNAVPFDIPPELQQLTREAEVHNTSSVSAADADIYGDEPRQEEEDVGYYNGGGGGQHIHRQSNESYYYHRH